jgi:hypothetical protein
MRPATLARVAELALEGDAFDYCLASFLDGFRSCPSDAALAPEPARLAGAFGRLGQVQDAYLAAAADELARTTGRASPAWAVQPDRALRIPWFASQLAALRAVLIFESPPGFRARNLFVSANALHRA